MKKPSKLDIGVLAITAVLFLIIGWSASAIWHNKPPVQIENPINTVLVKHSDSLEAVIVQRDLIIANNDKAQFVHDSIIINNSKALKKDYDKIKNLNDSTRSAYIDSVLKKQGIRAR